MGNRAVITTAEKKIGIYLHWNGGPESVLAFLAVAKSREYRCPDKDPHYGMARLCGLICEYIGPTPLSVGIGLLEELDTGNSDNGVYVVGADWAVVERWGRTTGSTRSVAELSSKGRETYDAIVESLSNPREKP